MKRDQGSGQANHIWAEQRRSKPLCSRVDGDKYRPLDRMYEPERSCKPINMDVLRLKNEIICGAGVLLGDDGDVEVLLAPVSHNPQQSVRGRSGLPSDASVLKAPAWGPPPRMQDADVELERVHKNKCVQFRCLRRYDVPPKIECVSLIRPHD